MRLIQVACVDTGKDGRLLGILCESFGEEGGRRQAGDRREGYAIAAERAETSSRWAVRRENSGTRGASSLYTPLYTAACSQCMSQSSVCVRVRLDLARHVSPMSRVVASLPRKISRTPGGMVGQLSAQRGASDATPRYPASRLGGPGAGAGIGGRGLDSASDGATISARTHPSIPPAVGFSDLTEIAPASCIRSPTSLRATSSSYRSSSLIPRGCGCMAACSLPRQCTPCRVFLGATRAPRPGRRTPPAQHPHKARLARH